MSHLQQQIATSGCSEWLIILGRILEAHKVVPTFFSFSFIRFLPSFLQPVQIRDLHSIDSTTEEFPQWFILRRSQNLRVHRIELYREWWVWKGFGRKRPTNNRGRNPCIGLDRLSKTFKNLRLSFCPGWFWNPSFLHCKLYLYCYNHLPRNFATCLKCWHWRINGEYKKTRWPKRGRSIGILLISIQLLFVICFFFTQHRVNT